VKHRNFNEDELGLGSKLFFDLARNMRGRSKNWRDKTETGVNISLIIRSFFTKNEYPPRRVDRLSGKQLVEKTGLSRQTITKYLNWLEDRDLVTIRLEPCKDSNSRENIVSLKITFDQIEKAGRAFIKDAEKVGLLQRVTIGEPYDFIIPRGMKNN
jgi:hypothetical protein